MISPLRRSSRLNRGAAPPPPPPVVIDVDEEEEVQAIEPEPAPEPEAQLEVAAPPPRKIAYSTKSLATKSVPKVRQSRKRKSVEIHQAEEEEEIQAENGAASSSAAVPSRASSSSSAASAPALPDPFQTHPALSAIAADKTLMSNFHGLITRVRVTHVLGVGANSFVFEGFLNDNPTPKAIKVAIGAPPPKSKSKTAAKQSSSLLYGEAMRLSHLKSQKYDKMPIYHGHYYDSRVPNCEWIVFEKMDGTLESLLSSPSSARIVSSLQHSVPQTANLLLQLISTLEGLHQARHIHLDVKPANFLYSSSASGALTIALTDFGSSVDAATASYKGGNTPLWKSRAAHAAKSPTYADDLEGLAFILYDTVALIHTGRSGISWISEQVEARLPAMKDTFFRQAAARQMADFCPAGVWARCTPSQRSQWEAVASFAATVQRLVEAGPAKPPPYAELRAPFERLR